MTQAEKAKAYDDYIRESDNIQRINSKLKSEYLGNPPPEVQKILNENERKIAVIIKKVEALFY